MTDVIRNFLLYRLCKEKIDEFEKEIKEIGLSSAEDKGLQNLENQMKSQLKVVSELRQFKIAALKHKHDAEEQAIRQSFQVPSNYIKM